MGTHTGLVSLMTGGRPSQATVDGIFAQKAIRVAPPIP